MCLGRYSLCDIKCTLSGLLVFVIFLPYIGLISISFTFRCMDILLPVVVVAVVVVVVVVVVAAIVGVGCSTNRKILL